MNDEQRERKRQRERERYQRNREAKLAQNRAWSKANKERHRELQHRWAKANPDKMKAAQVRYRRKKGVQPRTTFDDRLAEIDQDPVACWLWPGAIDEWGYGRQANRLAHREAYRKLRGEIPPNRQLHHICGNPSCVNPAHLQVVTPAEHRRLHAS